MQLRGLGRVVVRFTVGEYSAEQPGSGPVDVTISADPLTHLLVASDRLSPWPAVALGLLSVGGPKAGLAPGLNDLFVYP